ncbi:MAG: SPOR domain-containing protein [candidate division KSB1 bacterium]|nr:SPOR domain-containing protein [candidate division KSB1 bacterium]
MFKRILIIFCIAAVSLSLGCRKQENDEYDTFDESAAVGQGTDISEPISEPSVSKTPSYRNLPYSFGKPKPGNFAIIAGKFNNLEKAIELSRKLRRQRINNYIYQESEKSYLVLIGNFVTRAQTEKNLKYLKRKGLDHLEIYAAQ